MKQSKINKFIEDRELAIDLYNNTAMKISEISRLIKRSETTVDHMITGKLPKYVSGHVKTKTKTYSFTENEIMTIRDALVEYYQMIKDLKPNSPIAIRNQKNAKALKEQFVQDASLI